MKKSILIVEDNGPLANGIKLAIQSDELTIHMASTLSQAKEISNELTIDLIILDINLPDGNGLDFLTYSKERHNSKIIILTANDMETDVVTGLEMGADDYITKPFSLMILRARVKAQLRTVPAKKAYTLGPYVFDFDKMMYTNNHQQIELSKTEQKLLRILIENKGQNLTRGQLVDRIWSNESEFVDENALSVTIKRLRDKLEEDPSKPQYIKTIYGIGYTWVVS